MFDDEHDDEGRGERVAEPGQRAKEKAEELRVHAQLAAVFEGVRKFDAELKVGLDAEVAREVQRGVGKLEKAKTPESPVLPEKAAADAASVLKLGDERGLAVNDYHVYRRPGEVMVVRWLAGEGVETFYKRLQAHMDAALEGAREDEREALGWKGDEKAKAYLEALDKVEMKMAEWYLREPIRKLGLFVLSTQTADEIDISYLCDHVMGVDAAQLVGPASAPPGEGASESERAWFFKLFAVRGVVEGVERMCFFTYMQKAEEGGW